MNEEVIWSSLGVVLGIYLLLAARKAWQEGEISDYSDGPAEQFSIKREPDKFMDQWMKLVIGGLLCLGFSIWGLYQSFHH